MKDKAGGKGKGAKCPGFSLLGKRLGEGGESGIEEGRPKLQRGNPQWCATGVGGGQAVRGDTSRKPTKKVKPAESLGASETNQLEGREGQMSRQSHSLGGKLQSLGKEELGQEVERGCRLYGEVGKENWLYVSELP